MRYHWMLALLLAACGTSGKTVEAPREDAADTHVLADERVLPATDATSSPDHVGPPDLGPELLFDADESEDAFQPGCAPGEGCFLDPCNENTDCLSGWCVEHLGDSVCTQVCQEECPPGWTCKLLGSGGPDPVYSCVSNVSNLCKPCTDHGDCKAPGAQDDLCLRYGNEGAFCGGACSDDSDCPWGFSCTGATTVEGVATQQCMADAGICPCTQRSVALGLSTPCTTTSEAGTCAGKRVCTESGLSPCDASTAVPEVCNGLDDDCDGDVDEPDAVGGNLINLCHDDNACTVDTCLGSDGCQQEALDAGECIDGDACTVGDHCVAGLCTGTPIDCNDQDPCTDDSCDGLGGCSYQPNTADCDDGNACTVADECANGICSGFPLQCDCTTDKDCAQFEDDDLCNGTLFCDTASLPYQCRVDASTVVTCPPLQGESALCNAAACASDTGACIVVPVPDQSPCDDNDPCTVTEHCQAGQCLGGIAVNCNDGNPCTDDSCQPETGCMSTPNQADCEDGNVCTAGDTCLDGICEAGPSVDCDDGNPCTSDTCLPGQGCLHEATDGVCDDGNACTSGDHCQAGACTYDTLVACDDENLCTTDSCNPATGCTFALNSAPCNDDDLCTTGDHCHLGECIGGPPLPCQDNNPCTDDSCQPDTGCTFVPNTAACSDASLCTVGDQCSNGSCVPGKLISCQDESVCTLDSCHPELGCQHVPLAGPCDDGNACTLEDTCDGGACISGLPLVCNDNNGCTDDSCAPESGCIFVPNTSDCTDNDACTEGDTCANGSCQSGQELDCDDLNPCTDDGCNAQSGCTHTPVADGTECDLGKTCQDGQCTSCGQLHGSQTFNYTGGKQTFIVPQCITQVTITASGAEAGQGQKGAPGKGGRVVATVSVTPGETLSVTVGAKGNPGSGSTGGSGGFNGGGQGTGYGNTCYTGGGGGGASDVRRGGDTLDHRVVVAGGGGGGGGDPSTCHASWGAAGGGLVGQDAQPSVQQGIDSNGKGGTQSAGGKGGSWNNGNDGAWGIGGQAGAAGGGGGGGYYGGGGGGHGGGGGGSSFTVNGAVNVSHSQGVQSGHGQVVISW